MYQGIYNHNNKSTHPSKNRLTIDLNYYFDYYSFKIKQMIWIMFCKERSQII